LWRPRRAPGSARLIDEQQHDPAGNEVDDSNLGEHVASYPGHSHTVHISDDGMIHVHKRRTAPTRDKTHSERLRELSRELARIWEKKS
jgi:hypothetical protein